MFADLSSKLTESAAKTLDFFETKLLAAGPLDPACYFKSPMLFICAHKPEFANKVLDYIKAHYLQPEGDFMASPSLKSTQGEYAEFWIYMNGWILRAAHILERKDITEPALAYFDAYSHSNGGYLTHKLDRGDGITDMLSTAHGGLLQLERGGIERAIAAGEYLCNAWARQPDLETGCYLRADAVGHPMTEFTDLAWAHTVSKREPHQAYFMIGYPAAFLVLLYEHTGRPKYLETAIAYLDYALDCDKSVLASGSSHKIAWACALMYKRCPNSRYIKAITEITDYFRTQQTSEGLWYPDKLNQSYDQSAEIACWFLEIAASLTAFDLAHASVATLDLANTHSCQATASYAAGL
jgi:hypothetical protein